MDKTEKNIKSTLIQYQHGHLGLQEAYEEIADSVSATVMPSLADFKAIRKKLRFSQRMVGSLTGVSHATISRLESGKEVSYSSALTLFNFYRANGA